MLRKTCRSEVNLLVDRVLTVLYATRSPRCWTKGSSDRIASICAGINSGQLAGTSNLKKAKITFFHQNNLIVSKFKIIFLLVLIHKQIKSQNWIKLYFCCEIRSQCPFRIDPTYLAIRLMATAIWRAIGNDGSVKPWSSPRRISSFSESCIELEKSIFNLLALFV